MAIYSKSILSVLIVILLQKFYYISAFNINKRNAAPDNDAEDLMSNNNQIRIAYDEYPMVVPKRAALLLDRLMVALHHALEDEDDGVRKISDVYGNGKNQFEKEKYLELMQAKNPSLKNLINEVEKGRYDIFGANDLVVRDMKLGDDQNDLQGRTIENDTSGRSTGRVYWRCYFNAVSCF